MIIIAVGLFIGILLALDVQKSLRTGSTATMVATYSRRDRRTAFWLVWGIKALMSGALAILVSLLIVRDYA